MESCKEINVTDLEVGMYVFRLDRSWLGTPYAVQGFHIKSQDDINTLRHYCKKVYIDTIRSKHVIPKLKVSTSKSNISVIQNKLPPFQHTLKPVSGSTTAKVNKLVIKHHFYDHLRKPLYKELKTAKQLHFEVANAVLKVINAIYHSDSITITEIKQASKKMVASIIRNPDAFVWLYRLKSKDPYIYSHSVRVAIWATILGRYIGLAQDTLDDIALGALLSNIGKAKLPATLLQKNDTLTAEEYSQVQQHIQYAINMLEHTADISSDVIAIVATHCERFNGSGYPKQLQADMIPLSARIVGLADFYDAITNPRPYAQTMTAAEAIGMLYSQRNKLFQGELIDEFIQAIGLYPTGTLVELNNHQVAIVTSQPENRRLQPQVMLLLDENKKPLARNKVIDLHDTILSTQEDQAISIVSCLPIGSYDLHLDQIDDRRLYSYLPWKLFA